MKINFDQKDWSFSCTSRDIHPLQIIFRPVSAADFTGTGTALDQMVPLRALALSLLISSAQVCIYCH